MERGHLEGVSAEVLAAVARALRLDDAETEHLFDLARSAAPSASRRRERPEQTAVRPSLQRFLDTITGTPTWVRDRQMDIVATNPLRRRASFTPIGSRAPAASSRRSGPRPAGTPTTRRSPG